MFRRLFFSGLVCALATAGRADSRELPVIRNTQLGFNYQFHNHYWTPLRVEIDNPGPERHAVLVIEPVSHAAGQIVTLAKPIWLPANSRRTIFLTVLPEYNETVAPTKRGETVSPIPKVLSAKLTDGGLQVWSQADIHGRVLSEIAALMLVGDARLTSYRIPPDVPAGFSKRAIERAGVVPANLPARAIDYEGFNLIVLGDPGATDLNAMQRQAIVEWVRAGGTLVFTPSPGDTNGWFESWQAFLPVTYQPGDTLATEPRISQWGAPPVFAAGLRLRRMIVRAGSEVLAGTTDSPLLVTRREGLGHVVACALDTGDLNFQFWPGAVNLNAELIRRALHTIPAADRLFEKSTATGAIVSSLAGIKVLGRAPLLIYLIALVAGIITIMVVFQFTRRPERGWAVVVGCAVIAGGVVIVVVDRWKGQPQPFLNEVSLTFVNAEADSAVANAALGLYSPKAAKFDLDTTGNTARLRSSAVGRLSSDPVSMQFDDHLQIPGLAVRASDVRTLYGAATLPGGPLPQARAQLTPAGLELTVNNPTGQPLSDCFFKLNRLVVPLGDLPAGATRTLKNLAPDPDRPFSSRAVASAEDELRSRIRRIFFPDPVYTLSRQRTGELLGLHMRSALADWSPAVYGWSDQPVFPLRTGNTLARRAVGLWAIETPLAYTGGRLAVPRGMLTLHLKNTDARIMERAEGRFSGTRGVTIVAEFALPVACPDLQVDTAKLIVVFRGSAFKCDVQLQPPGSGETPQHQPSLTGGPEYQIATPGKWYDPARRSFTVAIKIEPTNANLAQPTAAVNYWQIRELDLELEGTTP